MDDKTITFSLANEKESLTKNIFAEVYLALLEKGYDPINQLAGYILSLDPTYITTYHNARNLITRVDRDVLLKEMIKIYAGQTKIKDLL